MSCRLAENAAMTLLRSASASQSAIHRAKLAACSSSSSRCCRRRHRSSLSLPHRRTYATRNDGGRIAVLGGGLTGLTTAYYLAKRLPSTASITLYEGSDRLGGWIRTDRVPVDVDGVKGTVSFERGPRTLSSLHSSAWRFDDLVLYDLALDLGLDIVSPPDQPRYIYYPDHLVTLPPAAPLTECLREPLFLKSIWAGLGFLWRRSRASAVPIRDMSVSEWLYEVSGSRSLADNFASAMVHGIYGGDIDKLSARSVLDRLYWGYYLPSTGGNTRQMTMREQVLMSELSQDASIRKLALKAQGALLHFGSAGMDSLTKALEHALRSAPNVDIQTGRPVEALRYNVDEDRVEVSTGASSSPQLHDRVIATLSSHDLARITADELPSLARTHAVSVMTVNLWYPQENLKAPGFGYLIPRSVPQSHNPERALGVFYDSDVSAARCPDEPPGTKLFVLMGGHYYDSGAPPPSESSAIQQAKSLVERHLGIPSSTPCFALSHLAARCIPQHHIGHNDLMMQIDQELRDAFRGALAVAGGSYSKIGAMAAIRAGYDIARQTVVAQDGWRTTGLEQLEFPEQFVGVPLAKIPVRRFPNAPPSTASR